MKTIQKLTEYPSHITDEVADRVLEICLTKNGIGISARLHDQYSTLYPTYVRNSNRYIQPTTHSYKSIQIRRHHIANVLGTKNKQIH